MTDAVLLSIVAIVPTTVGSLGTFVATRAALLKSRTEGEQGFVTLLLQERQQERAYVDAALRERDEKIRELQTEVTILQGRHRQRVEQDDVLDELDKQIRHDGATLIRNLLTVLVDHGIERPDLTEKARTLEKVRDMRREAAGLSAATAMVPK